VRERTLTARLERTQSGCSRERPPAYHLVNVRTYDDAYIELFRTVSDRAGGCSCSGGLQQRGAGWSDCRTGGTGGTNRRTQHGHNGRGQQAFASGVTGGSGGSGERGPLAFGSNRGGGIARCLSTVADGS
jgi:hypothetical protein